MYCTFILCSSNAAKKISFSSDFLIVTGTWEEYMYHWHTVPFWVDCHDWSWGSANKALLTLCLAQLHSWFSSHILTDHINMDKMATEVCRCCKYCFQLHRTTLYVSESHYPPSRGAPPQRKGWTLGPRVSFFQLLLSVRPKYTTRMRTNPHYIQLCYISIQEI